MFLLPPKCELIFQVIKGARYPKGNEPNFRKFFQFVHFSRFSNELSLLHFCGNNLNAPFHFSSLQSPASVSVALGFFLLE